MRELEKFMCIYMCGIKMIWEKYQQNPLQSNFFFVARQATIKTEVCQDAIEYQIWVMKVEGGVNADNSLKKKKMNGP